MKKNLMSLAVAAGVAGITASAQAAMYVNPEGTGQVLLFPYYNAEGTNETSVHIVNTTGNTKAVKVRFLEYVNSEEVLDFNLYLSPKDHFSFTVFSNPNEGAKGAAIVTRDNSCTVPALGDDTVTIAELKGSTTTNADGSITRIQPFLPYQYSADKSSGTERTNAGHIEIIEMGEVNDVAGDKGNKYATWAKHDEKGVPANCAGLVSAWKSTGMWGKPAADGGDTSDGITAATGGLYGLSNALNRTDAAAFGIEPKAISNFWPAGASNHSNPGTTAPTLASGATKSLVPNAGSYLTLDYTGNHNAGEDAVSSLFMTDAVMNDVMLNADLNGETDWVVTFPTRRFYVKELTAARRQPFTDRYETDKLKSACETVTISPYDREEAYTPPSVDGPIFSPPPPDDPTPTKPELCFEMNTIVAGSGTADSALNATIQATSTDTAPAVRLAAQYPEGWQSIGFVETGQVLTAVDGEKLSGLPAVGFGAFKYVNGDMSFGFVADHKTNVSCSGGTDC